MSPQEWTALATMAREPVDFLAQRCAELEEGIHARSAERDAAQERFNELEEAVRVFGEALQATGEEILRAARRIEQP